MPYYKGVIDALIGSGCEGESQNVAERLLRLRTRLKKEIPERNVNRSILLATWNLREFGRNDKYGKRLDESVLYIAEIISRFDLIAIQEVNLNLGDLQTLMKLLGNWWEYIVTDVTPGPSGNQERIAFILSSPKPPISSSRIRRSHKSLPNTCVSREERNSYLRSMSLRRRVK